MAIEEFVHKLVLDAKKFIKGSKQATEAAGQYTDAMGRLRDANGRFVKGSGKAAKGARDVGGAFSKLAANTIALNQATELLAKAYRGLGVAVGSVITPFAEYEKALVGVGKTTNISGKELQGFGDSIQAMSEIIPVAANDLLEIAQAAGQLGVTGTDNLLNFSETIAKLGVASDLSGDAAATSLTRILNVTGTSIDQIDELASTVVALGNNFAATESEITRVATEVSRATSVFGVTADQSAALGAALRSVGIQAELGGSAVGKAFRTIDASIRQGGTALQDLADLTGMTGEELRTTFAEDSVQVFQKFIGGLKNVQDSGRSVSLELEKFGLKGDEISKTLPVLAQRADLVGKALDLAGKEMKNATALTKEAATAFDTVGSDIQRTRNVFTNLASDIGQVMAPAFRDLLGALRELAPVIKSVFLAVAAIDFAGITQAVSDSAIAIATVLVPAILLLKPALIASAIAAGVLVVKFIAIGAAIGAAVAAIDFIIRNFHRIPDAVKIVGSNILIFWNDVMMGMNDMMAKFLKGIFSGVGKIASLISKDLGAAVKKIEANIDASASAFNKRQAEQNAALEETIEKASTPLDFGLFGKVFEEGKKALDKFNSGLEETKKLGKEASAALPGAAGPGGAAPGGGAAATAAAAAARAAQAGVAALPAVSAEDLKTLNKENEKIAENIATIGLAGIPLIRKQTELESARLQVKITELEAQEQLTSAQREQLKLLKEQKGLVEARGAAQIEQAKAPPALVDQSQLDTISGALGDGISGAVGAVSGTLSASFMGPIAAAQGIINVAQGVVDAIPQLLNSFAGLLNSITDLPNAIAEGVQAVLDGIVNLVQNFIPNIINAVTDILMSFADFLAEGLPQALESLPDLALDALFNLLDKLPEIVEKLVVGGVRVFILAIPKMTIALIKAIPAVMKAIVKAVPAIIDALIDGVVQGLKEIADVFLGLTSGALKQVGKTAEQGFEVLGEQLTGASSQLFEVIEGTVAARGQDTADKIRDAIASATRGAGSFLQRIWRGLMDLLKLQWEAVQAVWETMMNLLSLAWEGVKAIWDTMVNILKLAWEGLMAIWQASLNVLKVVWEGAMAVFQSVVELLKGAWDAAMIVFDTVVGVLRTVWNTAMALFENAVNFFKNIWQIVLDMFSGKINLFEAVGRVFDEIFKTAANAFKIVFDGAKAIFDKVVEMFQKMWDNLIETFQKAAKPITDFLANLEEKLKDAAKPLTDFAANLGTKISEAAAPLTNFLSNLGTKVSEAFAPATNFLNNIVAKFQSAFNLDLSGLEQSFRDMFSRLDPSNLLSKMFTFDGGGRGTIEKLLGIDVPFVAFAEGGFVPGNAPIGGDSLANDKVVSMLSPGEFVIPRSIAQNEALMNPIKQIMAGEFQKFGLGGFVRAVAKGDINEAGKELAGTFKPSNDTAEFMQAAGESISSKVQAMAEAIAEQAEKAKKFVPTLENQKDKIREMLSSGLQSMLGGTLDRAGLPKMQVGGAVVGADTVPALLQPGEFIVSSGAAESLGIDALRQANATGTFGGGGTTNVVEFQAGAFQISVQADQFDETFVRGPLMDTIKEELREATTGGENIISEAGVF